MTFFLIGGIDVTLTGYGFSEDDNVTIAGSPCKKKSTTPTQIVCTAPNSVSKCLLIVVKFHIMLCFKEAKLITIIKHTA